MKKYCHIWLLFVLGGCLVSGGCNGPIYTGGGMFMPGRVSPRSGWRAFGDLRNCGHAIDDNVGTAAVSGIAYQGAAITIDLGRPCQFNMIVLEHGVDEFGFCRRLAVYTSDDGRQFHRETEVPGLRRVTTVVLPVQALAQYIRLEATSEGNRPWSISEIHVQ